MIYEEMSGGQAAWWLRRNGSAHVQQLQRSRTLGVYCWGGEVGATSRAQPLQLVCSSRVTRCLGAPVPANGFRHVCSNTETVLVTDCDRVQCFGMSLGGSKLEQPQRFSVVLSNATATAVHIAQSALCAIKALRCSQPIKRNRLGVIHSKSSFTQMMQSAEHVLTVSAAPA